MGRRKKTYHVRKRKGNNITEVAKRSTDMNHVPNDKQYLDCAANEQKIAVVKQEQIEVTIESGDADKNNHDESRILHVSQDNTRIDVLKQERIEVTAESGDVYKKDDDESKSETLRQIPFNKKIDALKQELIEVTIESDDDYKNDDESRSDKLRQTLVHEELWVVRRQLCRGCHSDGAFWSLQTTTEGDTYGDLLQTYFNIQLCPVSKDEHALSAICTLCASRLREARAFSAQTRAAEERFTRFYKQNRVIALVNEDQIKKDVTEIKNEEVDDIKITDDVVPDAANSNLDKPESSLDELPPTLNKNKQSQVRCHKSASKKCSLSQTLFKLAEAAKMKEEGGDKGDEE